MPTGAGSAYAAVDMGYFFLAALSSLNIYSLVFAGWSSNSKYPLVGSVRSAAQMISYEVSLGILLSSVALCTGSLNLVKVAGAQTGQGTMLFAVLPLFLMYMVTIFAETNRPPFDLPEAESEIVSGYNLEYSSMAFALFFIAEYNSILIMASTAAIAFFGGLSIVGTSQSEAVAALEFGVKVGILCFIFIIIRAVMPRYRYDQLMHIGWTTLLPLSLSYFVLLVAVLVGSDSGMLIYESD